MNDIARYNAVSAFINNQTDEAWDKLVSTVNAIGPTDGKRQLEVVLEDADGASETTVRTRILHSPNEGILIRPEGYGDKFSSDVDGWPVMIELYEGDIRVMIWGDIRQEDCTEIISLEDARID